MEAVYPSKTLLIYSFKSIIPQLPETFKIQAHSFENLDEIINGKYKIDTFLRFYSNIGVEMQIQDFEKLEEGEMVFAVPEKSAFPYKELLEFFEIDRVMQIGGNYVTKLVNHTITKKTYSLRITTIPDNILNSEKLQKIFSKLKHIKNLNHKGIIKLYNFFNISRNFYFICEYVEGISLHQYLTNNSSLIEDKIKKIVKQILDAVAFFHSQGIYFVGVKLHNIQVTNENIPLIKLIDFRVSTFMEDIKQIDYRAYSPPEILKSPTKRKRGPVIDAWSIGALSYYFFLRKFPFYGKII